MATKKSQATAVAVMPPKSADVGAFDAAAVSAFAVTLGIDISGTHDERANLAAEHMNRSQRHMLASGLLLASIKAECEHGRFVELIEARGFEARAAQKAMQYAAFICSRPEGERLRLIELPRSKVMELASADPEVIEQVLADGVDDVDTLSVRKLRDRIRELEEQTADLAVQRDTAEAEAEGLRKKVKRGLPEREDQIPHDVADKRAEIMALGKRLDLTMASFQLLGAELVGWMGSEERHEWADPTLRLALSQLLHLRLQLDGQIKAYLKELPGGDPTPAPASYLSKDEVLAAARQFAELTQIHTYEAALREWEREQARPKGKGRPKDKPLPPQGAKA